MIKVFVVVTGLALAQLNDKRDVVSIDFPLTQDFPVPGDPDFRKTDIAWDEPHEIHAEVVKDPPPATPLSFTNKLKISSGPRGRIDFSAASRFPDLTRLHGGSIRGSRSGCRSGSRIDACQALSKPLLSARAQLVGEWELIAGYTNDQGEYLDIEHDDKWPVVRFRTPALDPANSLLHPFAGGRLANTLVFYIEMDDGDTVTVKREGTTDLLLGHQHLAPSSECDKYQSASPKCIIIRLMNHRICQGSCDDEERMPAWAKDKADTHFLQLYRLLDAYNPGTDELRVRPMMPFPFSETAETPGTGASSPRCYPAVRSP